MTEDAKKAKAARDIAWARANSKLLTIRLCYATDDDILDWMDAQENKQGYIKSLIREDIAQKNTKKNAEKKQEENTMELYAVKNEFTEGWLMESPCALTKKGIASCANEWEKTVEELMEQVEEIHTVFNIRELDYPVAFDKIDLDLTNVDIDAAAEHLNDIDGLHDEVWVIDRFDRNFVTGCWELTQTLRRAGDDVPEEKVCYHGYRGEIALMEA